MRSFAPIALLFGLSLAAPTTSSPQADHPALASLQYTAQQFGIVVTELNQFNGDPLLGDQIIRHSQETLRSLGNAVMDVKKGPTFDIWTTLQLVSPMTNLNVEVHQMANALKTKKEFSDKARISPVIFNLLKQTYAGASDLSAALVEKLPMGVSAVTGVLSSEIVSTIATVRDLYRPDRDVTVIIADPNRPISGGFQVQPVGQGESYPPQGSQYPPQSYSPGAGYTPQSNQPKGYAW